MNKFTQLKSIWVLVGYAFWIGIYFGALMMREFLR
jgi:hypothetical protein